MAKVSKTGYKKNSKDKNEPALVIPSNRITMKDVEFPVIGISDTGDIRKMEPGEEHLYSGNFVYEIPMARYGGDPSIPDLSNRGWLSKYQTAGEVKPTSNFTLPSLDPQAQQSVDYAKGWEKYNKGVEQWTDLLADKERKKGRSLTTEEKQKWLQKAVRKADGRKTEVDPNDPKWNFLFKDSYQTYDPEFGPMTVMTKPVDYQYNLTDLDKKKQKIAANTREGEMTPFAKSLGMDPLDTRVQKRASQNANDQVALEILGNKPQGDRTRVEWLNSLTPEERSTIERSQYAGKLDPDFTSQFSQGFEKNLRNAINAFRPAPGVNAFNQPLWTNPDYTQEEAVNASAMGVLAPLSYPSNLVTGAITGDFGSALQGQRSKPLFTDYRQPEFAATMSGLSETIYDPLNAVGVGFLESFPSAQKVNALGKYIIPKTAKVPFQDLKNAFLFKDKNIYNESISPLVDKNMEILNRITAIERQAREIEDPIKKNVKEILDPYFQDAVLQVAKDQTGLSFDSFNDLLKYKQDLSKSLADKSAISNSFSNYELSQNKEWIKQRVPSKTTNFTNVGEQQITDFTTGDKVLAKVTLPEEAQIFKIGKDKSISKDVVDVQLSINDEYVTTLNKNIEDIEKNISGAKVFGSAKGISSGKLPHLSNDYDVLISKNNYNKNVKNKYEFIGDNGPAAQHNVYPKYENDGVIDFVVIDSDSKGKASGDVANQIFRQFFPEEFFKASKEALRNKSKLKIPYTPDELIANVDPEVKTIMDAYESSKQKHINRIDAYINFGNPDLVAKAQEKYIKSLVGKNGSIGHQFSVDKLKNIESNKKILSEIGFIGETNSVASDPKKMQVAINDYFINNSVFSRQLDKNTPFQDIEKAMTLWDPTQSGGSAMGYGLNNVKLGNPQFGEIYGNKQFALNLDTTDPLKYIADLKRQTGSNYVFTNDETALIKDILSKHLPEKAKTLPNVKTTGDFLFKGVGLSQKEQIALNDAYREFSSKTGIKALSNEDTFGNNIYSSTIISEFDKALDALAYSLNKDFSSTGQLPKSEYLRKSNIVNDYLKKQSELSFQNIENYKDFQKLKGILDSGLEKLNSRADLLRDRINTIENIIGSQERSKKLFDIKLNKNP